MCCLPLSMLNTGACFQRYPWSVVIGCHPPPIFFKKRISNSTSIVFVFVLAQSTQPVNWAAAIRAAVEDNDVSHVLDFGPGGTGGGAANFTACLAEGTGTQVILASHAHSDDLDWSARSTTPLFSSRHELGSCI